MTPFVLRRITFSGLLISACVLGSGMIASGQDEAASARLVPQEQSQIRTEGFRVSEPAIPPQSAITLEPATGWDLQVQSFDAYGKPLPEMRPNFRRLGEATAGEPGGVHTLTLRFAETVTLNHIKSTKDFRVERGVVLRAAFMQLTPPARCWCGSRRRDRGIGSATSSLTIRGLLPRSSRSPLA